MFDEYTKNQILAGKKVVTRRLRKNNHRPAIPNTLHKLKIDRTKMTYGSLYIISCEKGTLGKLNNLDAVLEGFNSKEEYLTYFKNINGTDAVNTPIWIIKFKYIPKT